MILVTAPGCSKSPYDLASVHGKVTLNGEPLINAKVMFAPIAKGESRKSGKPAFGLLQSGGTFVLGTYEPEDGAVVGEHWVTVIQIRDTAEKSRTPGLPRSATESAPAWARVIFPKPQSVVANQDNEININLTSDIIARHGELE